MSLQNGPQYSTDREVKRTHWLRLLGAAVVVVQSGARDWTEHFVLLAPGMEDHWPLLECPAAHQHLLHTLEGRGGRGDG